MNRFAEPRVVLTSTLMYAGRRWRSLVERVLVEHEISEAPAMVLLWVGRLGGGVRQVTLASYVGVQGAAMVRLIDDLCAKGLVERRDDPEDRRANTIWLTEEGERLGAHIEAALSTLRDWVLGGVSDADIEATLRVFDALEQAARGDTS